MIKPIDYQAISAGDERSEKNERTGKKSALSDLDALKRGESEAYYRLVHDHVGQLINYLTSVLKSTEEAEDICQDVFIDIWENRESLSEVRVLKNYIFAIARHKALKRKNSLKKISDNQPDELSDAVGFSVSPDEIVEMKQTERTIDRVVEKMPQISRKIYRLKYNEGYSNEEIGQELKITSSTVRTHVSLALQDIKNALDI